ncbi:photosystem II stability/assembly factor-like uncharacterized protein [Flavobacterium arsenatis]|uniref:Photosystem II stability/assembly factor-like uncharacterized protein n=1 Tax=Flavobacterium arsenatis TaxID=1484332 RepID=A0ABU1TTS0_9FLAO|nr:photosystem II stability/assembly factor-like uncharacterized protein [Flavobacterium arsenatis]
MKQNIYDANDIDFNGDLGFIVGNYGTVLKSDDGGTSWSPVVIGIGSPQDYNSVTVLDGNTVFISAGNKIAKTADGGITWQVLPVGSGIQGQITKSFFTSNMVGHAAYANGSIAKTVDGGLTWYATVANSSSSGFSALYFLNESTGVAARTMSGLYRTIDGGETWNEMGALSENTIHSFSFVGEVGYATGSYGSIYRTTDSGLSWEYVGFNNSMGDATDFNGIFFVDSNMGFATGDRGRIVKTTDGGASWNEYGFFYRDISSLASPDGTTLYARSGSDILASENSGDTWEIRGNLGVPGTTLQNAPLKFVNVQVGYAASGLHLYKTSDAGQSWSAIGTGSLLNDSNIFGMDFIDEDTGVISGGYNVPQTKKTTDGGITWQVVNHMSFDDIQFLSSTVGYARDGSSIYKTIDAGDTWDVIFTGNDSIDALQFVDENTGFLSGSSLSFQMTTDGGQTWQVNPFYAFSKIGFASPEIGYGFDNGNNIHKTEDGGATWEMLWNIPGVHGFAFVGSSAYLYGTYGKILRTASGVLSSGHILLPGEGIVIFPNPTHNKITISPKSKQDSITGIALFDMTGRKILNFNGMDRDSFEMDLGAQAAGVYIVKVVLDHRTVVNRKIMVR